MKKTIVTISGPIGSGKDTVADHLIKSHGFTKMSFSESLKDVCAAVFGWDRQMLEGTTEGARHEREQVDPWWDDQLDLGVQVTPRSMLQYVGTELFRNHFDGAIWPKSLTRKLMNSQSEHIVVTDARFLNELSTVRSLRETHKVIQLSISRKSAPWWSGFYEKVDEAFTDEFGVSFTDYPICQSARSMNTLLDLGKKYAPKGLHWSEVEFLLWPHYDKHLDNSGGLDHTIASLLDVCGLPHSVKV